MGRSSHRNDWADLLFLVCPSVLGNYYGQRRPLVQQSAPLSSYITGLTSPRNPGSNIVVINGTATPIDLYANGFWVDTVPTHAIREYHPLREVSRLTSVETATKTVLDDIQISDSGEKEGFLIYNVHGADKLRVEGPPRYR